LNQALQLILPMSDQSAAPDQCVICSERFPVIFRLFCGHVVCVLCAEDMIKKCANNNCPICRIQLPFLLAEWLPLIKIYPRDFTKELLLKIQHAFPLICYLASRATFNTCMRIGMDVNKGIFWILSNTLSFTNRSGSRIGKHGSKCESTQ